MLDAIEVVRRAALGSTRNPDAPVLVRGAVATTGEKEYESGQVLSISARIEGECIWKPACYRCPEVLKQPLNSFSAVNSVAF